MTRATVVAVVLLVALGASAQPLPASEWTPNARLWLARAQVGEAGWSSTVDHDAIAWTLARRWSAAHKRNSAIRFTDTVKAYCSCLYGRTDRQHWVRDLPSDGVTQPEGWPVAVSWLPHSRLWRAILSRLRAWGTGSVPDPSHGLAWHWGGPNLKADSERAARAIAGGRWYSLELNTQNKFYGLISETD